MNPGDFVLWDRVTPPLQQGLYQLNITQDISSVPNPPQTERFFKISGPRWGLDATQIHSVYPPKNSQSASNVFLPMAVLGRRTLPWEISIFDDVPSTSAPDNESEYPYMALLLLTEDEFKPDDNPKRDKLSVVYDSSSFNNLEPQPADMDVDYIRVKKSTLLRNLPTLEEMRLLAHVRQISMEDKAALGNDDDGWFAVVMGNRVPAQANTKYHACLVSLEGRLDYIPEYTHPDVLLDSATVSRPNIKGYPQTSAPISPIANSSSKGGNTSTTKSKGTPLGSDPDVNIVLLYQWTFTSGNGGDFEAVMKKLDVDLLATTNDPDVGDRSYVLCENTDSDGETNTDLYRGPFLSVQEPYVPKSKPYYNADQARALVQDVGMEDISHAAAFELGRLLALSDSDFVKNSAIWADLTMTELKENSVINQIKSMTPGTTSLQSPKSVAGAVREMNLNRLSRQPNLSDNRLNYREPGSQVVTTPNQTSNTPQPPNTSPSNTDNALKQAYQQSTSQIDDGGDTDA